ncbi:MAG: bifunctional serine/threonine-protein kinase/formylglycine-generating enzyme family protein [Acidobacteriota bacterium]
MTDRSRDLLVWYKRLSKLDEPERSRLLATLQAEDADFATKVRQLLEPRQESEGGFLRPPEPEDLHRMTEQPDDDDESEPWQLGRYRLFRKIGKGGMGQVWLAEQASLSRLVAVKVLRASYEEVQLERFRREAKAAGRLQHPHVVSVHEFDEDDGIPYIVMDYIEGCDLRDVLIARSDGSTETEATLDLAHLAPAAYASLMAKLLAGVAEALEHAHENRVWHRDVKPENILIDREGRALLADFGIAKDPAEPGLTRTMDIPGTRFYVSPEQAVFRQNGLDHRTDIFSLGVVLYEALTGCRPFDGDSEPDVLRAIREEQPPPPRQLNPAISRDLETIILRALEKQPQDRYASALELAQDLRAASDGKPIQARPPVVSVRARRFLERNRRVTLPVAATVALVLLVTATVLVTPRLEEHLSRPTLSLQAYRDDGTLLQGASVRLHRANPLGARADDGTLLGTTPIHRVRVPPGRHHLVIEAPAHGHAELIRTFPKHHAHEERVVIRRTEDVVAGMLLIEPAVTLAEWFPDEGMSSEQVVFEGVGGFHVDPFELSNRVYQSFLEDTSYFDLLDQEPPQRPPTWPEGTLTASQLELPVVGISYLDARRCAEWAGKRLPDAVEWQRAARGTDGRIYPWGDERLLAERAVVGHHSTAELPLESEATDDWHEQYLRALSSDYLDNAEPVDSRSTDVGPEGLHHALGNVEEWTNSFDQDTGADGKLAWNPGERIVMGASWLTKLREARLDVLRGDPIDNVQQNFIGCRFVKSRR